MCTDKLMQLKVLFIRSCNSTQISRLGELSIQHWIVGYSFSVPLHPHVMFFFYNSFQYHLSRTRQSATHHVANCSSCVFCALIALNGNLRWPLLRRFSNLIVFFVSLSLLLTRLYSIGIFIAYCRRRQVCT